MAAFSSHDVSMHLMSKFVTCRRISKPEVDGEIAQIFICKVKLDSRLQIFYLALSQSFETTRSDRLRAATHAVVGDIADAPWPPPCSSPPRKKVTRLRGFLLRFYLGGQAVLSLPLARESPWQAALPIPSVSARSHASQPA